MQEYLSEKEQIEQIRNWWRENGLFVIGGLAIGAALILGWNAFQDYRQRQIENASLLYEQLLRSVESAEEETAVTLASQIEDASAKLCVAQWCYASTPYAANARIALAKLYVESGQNEEAIAALREAIDLGPEPEMLRIARLRLARVLVYADRAEEALQTLEPVPGDAFAALYHELRGDAQLALGDANAARSEYERAFELAREGAVDRFRLQMKIDDLAQSGVETGVVVREVDES